MAILLMLNMKGGVAKTANAVAVAECLADEDHKVLMIDADHQCTASELLLGEEKWLQCEKRRRTLHDFLAAMLDDEFEDASIPPFIVEKASKIGGGYENLHIVPCSVRIDAFETNMAKAKREYRSGEEWRRELNKKRRILRRVLHGTYDYVIVDCPPSLALQVQVLLTIADAYIIPSIPDQLSVRGSAALLDRLRRSNFRSVRPLGLLWSLYRQGAPVHRHTVEQAQKGEPPFDQLPAPFSAIIPNAARIAESMEPDKVYSTFIAKYTTDFARRYRELCAEIRERLNATP